MSLKRYTETLVRLCRENQDGTAPYLLRTRFERGVYGLMVSYAVDAFGAVPNGVTRRHVEEFLESRRVTDVPRAAPMYLAADIFDRFTYLCDTSNWSNDGQDPRIEMCREDIIRLCASVGMPNDIGEECDDHHHDCAHGDHHHEHD